MKKVNKTKKVILINGLARSGKDTTAKIMQEELIKQGYSVKVLAFADKLKDMVCEMFNISRDELDDYKNNKVNMYLGEEYYSYPLTDFRTFLDIFGNKIAKTLGGESVWADIVLNDIQNSEEEYFIVPDFRFFIEYDVFHEHNFGWYDTNADDFGSINLEETPFNITTVQVQRDIPKMNLESEKALNNFVFDYFIDNNSDLDSLKGNVKELLGKILQENKDINKENKDINKENKDINKENKEEN